MDQQVESLRVLTPPKRIDPGHLLMPFGWAAGAVVAMLQTDITLYPDLIGLSRRRMHLIALAVAHCPGNMDMSLARCVLQSDFSSVVEALFGRQVTGLKRALDRLPDSVLPPESYRQLIDLLDTPGIAEVLFHQQTLSAAYLDMLHELFASIRGITSRTVVEFGFRPQGWADGLRLLAGRGAAGYEALVDDLAAIRQPAQFVARIHDLVEQLPLPEPSPPPLVGNARRLDAAREIRQLAKHWKNCVADRYLEGVNNGRSAVYVWPHLQTPAVCVVNRHGRLGWALDDARGPENAELPPDRMQAISSAFAAAGIPCSITIEPLEYMAHPVIGRHYRRAQCDPHGEVDWAEIRGNVGG
jgi:hypothetical protein